jgi:hypothetical protein
MKKMYSAVEATAWPKKAIGMNNEAIITCMMTLND